MDRKVTPRPDPVRLSFPPLLIITTHHTIGPHQTARPTQPKRHYIRQPRSRPRPNNFPHLYLVFSHLHSSLRPHHHHSPNPIHVNQRLLLQQPCVPSTILSPLQTQIITSACCHTVDSHTDRQRALHDTPYLGAGRRAIATFTRCEAKHGLYTKASPSTRSLRIAYRPRRSYRAKRPIFRRYSFHTAPRY